MTTAPILTYGFGSFGSVGLLPTLGFTPIQIADLPINLCLSGMIRFNSEMAGRMTFINSMSGKIKNQISLTFKILSCED